MNASDEMPGGATTMPSSGLYQRRVDRDHPSCFLFLVDQSQSMVQPVAGGGGKSKAEALCDAINNLLYELVIKCIKNPEEGPRHYFDIGVIGYGASVGPALSGKDGSLAGRDIIPISDVANDPLDVEDRTRKVDDGAGGILEQRVKFPIWLEPVSNNGTPMGSAMDQAGRLLAGWVQDHPDSFPPVVINISDGAATDGDPRTWASRLQGLATNDGNVLVFNLNISGTQGAPVFFPDNPSSLTDEYARTLFEMSSPLPGFMRSLAAAQGIAASDGARGFVFNADMVSVVAFLRIGTSTQHVLD
jgi:hypothetical protein